MKRGTRRKALGGLQGKGAITEGGEWRITGNGLASGLG